MKSNKIILVVLILSMIALIFSGCGGVNPVTPPIDEIDDDVDQEYIVEEEQFDVDTNQGGTYSLDDGTKVIIEPGDLISNTTLVIKKLEINLPEKQVGMTFTPKSLYDVGVLPGGGILGSIDLIIPMGPYQQVYDEGGEIIGLRYADGTFAEVESETLIEGEIKKVKLTIEETGTFMLYRNPKYTTERWIAMLNDLVSDTSKAKDYYEDGNCTQLENMYQQALAEEKQAFNELEVGLTKEDAIEIKNKIISVRFVFDWVIGGLFWPYGVYCAFTGTGEVLSYVNVYFEAQEKVDTYNAKYGKLVIIEDLYKSACDVGNHPPVISDLSADPPSVKVDQTTTITCIASDQDGDPLTYNWSKNGGSFEGDASGSSVTWRAPSTQGNYMVSCEVSDGEASDSDQVIISVGDVNHPPNIISNPVTSATKDEPYSYDVNATDPDVGDTLTYSFNAKPTGMNINSSTGEITWTPTSTGDYDVTVKVSDGELSDTQSFTVTVGGPTETFTITASAGAHGSISPSGNVTVNQGSDKLFTITPDNGYNIDDVLVDGSSVGAVSSYTFTNVTADHSISVTFSATTTGQIHNLTKDTYYNTIQAAFDNADSNNIIEVSDGTYDESITFPSGKIIILQSINGRSSTIIRGNDGSNTVTLNNSPDGTTLEGFTITHESGNSGRGIYIYSGYLSIKKTTISNNNLTDGDNGGIYNAGTGTLTITNSTVSDNTAGANSGGIRSTGTLTITNSIISNNTSDSGVGGIRSIGTSTIADSTISGNTGTSCGGIINNGTLTITNSTISDNISINCFDNAAGIINTGALTITNSTISDNSGGSRSGGIYSTLNAQLIITGSTISNNTSCSAGGGIFNVGALTITNSTISDNSGTSDHACGIFLQASSGPNIIGGSNENDFSNFNEFINNYKIGEVSSLDRHIRNADDGDCHMDYPYNYYTPDNNGTYALRDIGPAGGYIFYDKGSYSDGWRYLEAASASTEWRDKKWGSIGTFIGGTETGIGRGQSNTTTIVTWLNSHSETDRAAQLCDALTEGGYSDWFLPSKDELNLMFTNLKVFGVGGFEFVGYWSSSECSAGFAWYQSFSLYIPGTQYCGWKEINVRVRAVRAF